MNQFDFKKFIEEEDDSNDDNMVFFFKKDNEIYGGPEESRVVFARMKNPDKETDKNWIKEASFIGLNLSQKNKQSIFNFKDLDKIKIIPRELAIKQSKITTSKTNQSLDEK